MSDVHGQLAQIRLVPVVAIDRAEDAPGLADALVAGGLPCAEITFRTEAAEGAIKALAGRSDILLGAGTVLSVEQVDRARDAGARFIVSPGTNPQVVERCLALELPVFPGIATPTDIELARSFGLRTLKFFPAEALGGLKMLNAIAAPYRDVRFVPTGGVSADNLLDYLKNPAVVACGGSWMVRSDLIRGGRFDTITSLCGEAVRLVKSLKTS
jgi:2-dehydro-3-deoxyphosphogluconate aldolase/(4S)-4-hydroxy-2-oxoglutarate aldolase